MATGVRSANALALLVAAACWACQGTAANSKASVVGGMDHWAPLPPEFLDAEAFLLLVPERAKKALGLGEASTPLDVQVPRDGEGANDLLHRAAAVAACARGRVWVAVRLDADGQPQPATAATMQGQAPACVQEALANLGIGTFHGLRGTLVIQAFRTDTSVPPGMAQVTLPLPPGRWTATADGVSPAPPGPLPYCYRKPQLVDHPAWHLPS